MASSSPSDGPTSLDWEVMTVPSSAASPSPSPSLPPPLLLRTSVPTDVRFQGRTIVVTGAGGQLGREGCVYFAARGCRVVAIDLHPRGLRETYRAILQDQLQRQDRLGPDAAAAAATTTAPPPSFIYKPYVCDVTDAAAVERVVQHCTSNSATTPTNRNSSNNARSSIDMLWNNAGYQGQIAPILEQDPRDFANVMQINVTGMFHVLQAVGRRMVQQQQQQQQNNDNNNDTNNATTTRSCSIVNTASVAGLRGTPAMVAYASSKAAVMSMTVCAAKEWARHSVRCNALSPALIGPGALWERQNELHAAVGPPHKERTNCSAKGQAVRSNAEEAKKNGRDCAGFWFEGDRQGTLFGLWQGLSRTTQIPTISQRWPVV